jgi:hypothetical protein
MKTVATLVEAAEAVAPSRSNLALSSADHTFRHADAFCRAHQAREMSKTAAASGMPNPSVREISSIARAPAHDAHPTGRSARRTIERRSAPRNGFCRMKFAPAANRLVRSASVWTRPEMAMMGTLRLRFLTRRIAARPSSRGMSISVTITSACAGENTRLNTETSSRPSFADRIRARIRENHPTTRARKSSSSSATRMSGGHSASRSSRERRSPEPWFTPRLQRKHRTKSHQVAHTAQMVS